VGEDKDSMDRDKNEGMDAGDSGVPGNGVNFSRLLFCALVPLLPNGFLRLMNGRMECRIKKLIPM
jgi:hypothetical protein